MSTITNGEYVALSLLDFGFELPQFADAWPALIKKGWVVRRDDGLRVTPDGRRVRCAYNRWKREAPVAPVPVGELAALNPGLDQRGLARLQAFEQLIAEDDQACGYQDPEE